MNLTRSNGVSRLFSLFLCCIMLVGLFPTHAFAWDEVVECEYCGSICGDDYICSGGDHCSEASGRSCYEEHHCQICGHCEDDDFCEDCHMCIECAVDNECHCPGCGNCFVEYPPCPGGCGYCGECVDEWCDDCEMCVECATEKGNHCPDCGACTTESGCLICHRCFDCGGQCESGCTDACLTCHLENGVACEECGACFVEDDSKKCIICNTCADCAGDFCEDCHMCVECAVDNECHCPGCGNCFVDYPPCPGGCGHCGECVDEWCDDCEMCVECATEKGNHCPDCGACTTESGCLICHRCFDCGGQCESDCTDACLTCHLENEVACENCGVCFIEDDSRKCIGCNFCADCVDEFCEDCHMCVECAIDEKCHCPDCGSCFVDYPPCPGGCGHCGECVDEWCDDCEMCVECATEKGNHCPDCGACTTESGCLICHRCFDCGGQCGSGCTDACLTCHLENEAACEECGACFVEDDSKKCIICNTCADCTGDFCEDCHMCVECAVDEKCHCEECGSCFVDHPPCPGGCGRCGECVDEWCDDCEMCVECATEKGNHCPDCGACTTESGCLICHRCFDCGGQCNDGCTDACLMCHLENGTACEDCGACYLNDDIKKCSACDLCEDCTGGICDECGMCTDCAIDNGLHCADCGSCFEEHTACPGGCGHCDECADEWCDECEMCANCGIDNGTHCPDCGACTKDSGCLSCHRCESCAELCDKCGEYCRDCALLCENCGVCEGCATICYNCDSVCTECGTICTDCGMCEDCCKQNSLYAGCEHGVCIDSREWESHWETVHEDKEHKHVFIEYSRDENGHWQVCKVGSCDFETGYEEHTYGDWKVTKAATCKETGVKEHVCTACEYKEIRTIPVIDHTSSDWKSDEAEHWKECTGVGCGVIISGSKAAHTVSDWITDTAATATTDGTKHKECTVCYRVLETGTIPATGSEHTHNHSSAWKSDFINHWHECSCGNKTEIVAHTVSDWITDTSATDTTDGTKHKECTVCYRVLETGTIPAAGYTITFDAGKGTASTASAQTDKDGKLASLPTASRSSYAFEGWYTAASGGNQVTTDTVFTENSTVYACWTYNGAGATYYTLTFDTNGGSSISKITKTKGTTVYFEKYAPIKEGYEFTGWYSDKELTDKITSVKLAKNTIVYAGWKAIKEEPTTKEPNTSEISFADVDTDDWFFKDVAYVYDKGLMSGTSANTFAPSSAATRGMIVTILYRMENEPAVSDSLSFDDVKSGSYCENAIMWATANGIVSGYGNGMFDPDGHITREQMAVILWRYAKYAGYDVSIGENTNILSYDDALTVSEYAVPAMQWACGEGIISGTSDTTLSPQGNATRAQVAAILHRFCEKLGK